MVGSIFSTDESVGQVRAFCSIRLYAEGADALMALAKARSNKQKATRLCILRLEAGTLPLIPLLVTKANQSQASSQETESTLPYAGIEAPAGGVTVTAERSKELCVVVSCGAVSKGGGGIGGRKTPKGHQGTDIKVGR